MYFKKENKSGREKEKGEKEKGGKRRKKAEKAKEAKEAGSGILIPDPRNWPKDPHADHCPNLFRNHQSSSRNPR